MKEVIIVRLEVWLLNIAMNRDDIAMKLDGNGEKGVMTFRMGNFCQ